MLHLHLHVLIPSSLAGNRNGKTKAKAAKKEDSDDDEGMDGDVNAFKTSNKTSGSGDEAAFDHANSDEEAFDAGIWFSRYPKPLACVSSQSATILEVSPTTEGYAVHDILHAGLTWLWTGNSHCWESDAGLDKHCVMVVVLNVSNTGAFFFSYFGRREFVIWNE